MSLGLVLGLRACLDLGFRFYRLEGLSLGASVGLGFRVQGSPASRGGMGVIEGKVAAGMGFFLGGTGSPNITVWFW